MHKLTTVLIILFFVVSAISFINCSSTSGTLRYNGKEDKQLSNTNAEFRYSGNTEPNDDSLVIFEDEDVPEFQDPSDLPENESKIDLTSLMKSLDEKSNSSDGEMLLSSKRDLMIMEIIKYMNTPYKYGGNSLNGIDCSAFTQNVYRDSWLLNINRSAREQYKQGIIINDRSELKFGDLVFFNTRRRVKPGHVGIYIGENLFAHASSKLGVTISSLEHDYYNKRYMGARRIEDDELLN